MKSGARNKPVSTQNHDFFMMGINYTFTFCDEFLVELLTCPQAYLFNIDFTIRFFPSEPDQFSGHMIDLYRFPHLKDEYLRPFTHGTGLENKLGGLIYRHEIPGNVWMRYGKGAASSNLFSKKRDDRA